MLLVESSHSLSQPLSTIFGHTGVALTDPVLESKMQTLQAVLAAVKSVLPSHYLPGYASPCWYANYTTAKVEMVQGGNENGNASKLLASLGPSQKTRANSIAF